eukprot:3737879-Rhodomonas_salina.5
MMSTCAYALSRIPSSGFSASLRCTDCVLCRSAHSMNWTATRFASALEYLAGSTPTSDQPPTPSITAVSVDPSAPEHITYASSPPFA